jgi:hypothetical protein
MTQTNLGEHLDLQKYAFLLLFFLCREPSVADPDPGWGKKSGSGMNIPDHFSKRLLIFFMVKNT